MSSFKALQVSEDGQGHFALRIVERAIDELPAGEVLIRVRYSSLNYKRALGQRQSRRDPPVSAYTGYRCGGGGRGVERR